MLGSDWVSLCFKFVKLAITKPWQTLGDRLDIEFEYEIGP